MSDKGDCFQFDTIEMSLSAFTVQRDGRRLNLEPKAVRVLHYLILHRDHVVTKDELVQAVWEGTAVTDNAVTRIIAQLRRELGDDPRSPRYIETYPTLGYRFIAKPREVALPVVEPKPSGRRQHLALAGVVCGVLAAGGWFLAQRTSPATVARQADVTQITTNPGVDARPSFSPDGRSMAYCSNRNGRFELYRRDLAGDAAPQAITSDGHQNIHPAWSPDGKWIAYHSVAQRGVWIVGSKGGGTPRRLTQFGAAPAWSPDSRSLAFTSVEPVSLAPFDAGGMGTIWTVALDGGSLRQWTSPVNPRGGHTLPSWSRDGKRLLFVSLARDSAVYVLDLATGQFAPVIRTGKDVPRQPGTMVSRVWDPIFGPGDEQVYFSAAGEKGEHSIWSIPASGGSPVRLYTSRSDISTGLTLSPDGKRLLFARLRNESQLWTLTEGGEPAPLFQDEVVRALVPRYSPDGKWIAFAVETQGRNRDLWVMPAAGGEPFPVSPEPGPKEAGVNWTPAGEFLYNYVAGGEVEFRAFDPATRKTRLIHKRSTAGLFHPVLMPNGKDVLSSCSTPFNVCVGAVQEASQRQLTFEREGATFAFSDRTGQWIAYEAKRGDSEQIGIVRADGTGAKILTHEPGHYWPNSFSPDSRRIAYAAFQGGIWTLWWIDRETGERRQLTKESAFGPFVRSPAWNPATNQIAYERYQVRGNIFSLDLP